MSEKEPLSEQERLEITKDAMARELMDFHGISYDAGRLLVEEMFARARQQAQEFTEQEEQ